MKHLNEILSNIPAPLFLWLLVSLGVWLIVGSTKELFQIANLLLAEEQLKRVFW